jgi:hypothetical protein
MNKYLLLVAISLFCQTAIAQSSDQYCSNYKKATTANRLLIEDLRSDSLDIVNTSLDLDLTLVSISQISGVAKLSCRSRLSGLESVTFDFEGLVVDSVKGSNVSEYIHQDSVLRVSFANPLGVNEEVEIEIYYHGSPMKDASGWGGFYFSGNFSWNLGVGFEDDPHSYGRVWFPCFDNFIERSTFDFKVRVNDDRRASCNGLLSQVLENNDGTTTYFWELAQSIPSYLACVAVGPYIIVNSQITAQNGSLPVQIHGRKTDSASIVASFQHLGEAVLKFEDAYGPYRFDKVGYSLVPFNSGAMEHATNITYPISASNGGLSQEDLMAHELAHMWWGDNVTCQTDGDMWINEGWASFSEYLFQEAVYGRDAYEKSMQEDLRLMLQFGHHNEGGYRAVSGQPHDLVYGDHVYKKGALVAHNLRGSIGDELFFEAIHNIMEDFKYSAISSDTLEKYFTQYSGIDMEPFFRDWVFSGGYNLVVLDSFLAVENGENYDVVLTLQQKLKGRENMHDEVPVYYSVFDSEWNQESGMFKMSGYRSQESIETSIEPVHVQLYFGNEQAQARTMDKVVVTEIESLDLKNMFWDVEVDAVEDSALVFFEHFWSQPDPVKALDIKPYRLSEYHYWRVSGLDLEKAEMSGQFFYDGRVGGYLDIDLVSIQEDSLVLLHRVNASDDWVEYEFYSKNILGQSDNAWGLIELDKILPGEYTLANLDRTILHSSDNILESVVEIFPNPARNEITVNLNDNLSLSDLLFEIYNIEGKLIQSESLIDIVTRMNVSNFSNGVYNYRLVKGGRAIDSGKFVLN